MTSKSILTTIIILAIALTATAAPDDINDNVKSPPAAKDKPLSVVPFFSSSLPTYGSESKDNIRMHTSDTPAATQTGIFAARAGMPQLGALPLRLDSVVERSKKQTITTTQHTKGRRGRRGKAIKVTKTVSRNYSLGLYVYDITADTVVTARNENTLMTPASTQKLYVASAFLNNRGRDFNFETRMTTDGRVTRDDDGRRYFKGDIYLHGSFDPTLTTDDVRAMADAIRQMDIDSIDGRIIVDNSIKAAIMQHKGWQWDKIPLSEEFTFTPVTFNEGRAAGGGRIRHPELYFASAICKLLMADYFTFSSPEPWDVSMTPVRGKTTLYRIVTPCHDVLSRMLKRSNNTYAESIMLNLCRLDESWSYERCRDIVRSTVRSSINYANKHRQRGEPKLSADALTDYYNIVDGSGLSHSNKTTAASQVNLLRYIASDRKLFSDMYNNLAIAGVDGTISKRMAGDATRNNVHAKTGTVNGVSTLSGYVTAPSGNLLAFAILVNGTYDMGFARALQDQICNELAQ